MNVWIISREYAGIAEAGGVKNVTCSLAENLVKLGVKVTLFIPMYGCTNIEGLRGYSCVWHHPAIVKVLGKDVITTFSYGVMNDVEIVFVDNKVFSEKKAVYTYTKEEEAENPEHRKGSGHKDVLVMNTLFQKAVVAYGKTCVKRDRPDIIHCQDASTALVPVFASYAKELDEFSTDFFKKTKYVVTIHNAGACYHHEFISQTEATMYTGLPSKYLVKGLCNGKVEPFLLAAQFATLTTVSEQYAQELLLRDDMTDGLSSAFKKEGISIKGITNGIEFDRYNPADTKTSLLQYPFDPLKRDFEGKRFCLNILIRKYASKTSKEIHLNKNVEQYGYLAEPMNDREVFISYHGRVVTQKGISVLAVAVENLLKKGIHAKFIFIGQGEPELEKKLINLAESFEGNCVFFNGYDKALSRLCLAASDIVVLPSNFEPCGLEDFIAQIYGTIPLAHATGGLCKIIDRETGFLYTENTPEVLEGMLQSLVKIAYLAGRDVFATMATYAARYIKSKYSWEKVVRDEYLALYESILEKK